MSEAVLAYEPMIRVGIFSGILVVMASWEILAPRRPQQYRRWQRWPHNLLLVAIDTLTVRLLFPSAAVGVALVAAERGWGLLNVVALRSWLIVALAVVMLDLAMYLQHRLLHSGPWLWRLHRVHHADLEFDVTTGLRFHPFEILVSLAIKLFVIVALGAPALAVLIFEVLLNATSLFNHGNVHLPDWLDRRLSFFVVTPDMHRVHHSVVPQETNSNFGFNLPWWDRVLCTYRAQPGAGHLGMMLGLKEFRDSRDLRVDRMLLQPLRNSRPGPPLTERRAA